MGLNANALRHVLRAIRQGGDLSSVGTIGRPGMDVGFERLRGIVQDEFRHDIPTRPLEAAHATGYAVDLLRLFGAAEVVSADASDYEQTNPRGMRGCNPPVLPGDACRQTADFRGDTAPVRF